MEGPHRGAGERLRRWLAGLLLIAIAGGLLIYNADLPLKDGNRLGSGAMPLAVLGLLLVMGIVVLLQGDSGDEEELPPIPWWRLAVIAAAILFFALTIRTLGMALAAFVLVAGSGLAAPNATMRGALIAGAVLSVFVVAVFSWGLGLYIPVLPALG